MQLIGAAAPDVSHQASMPQVSKQLLNACPIPPMHIYYSALHCLREPCNSINHFHPLPCNLKLQPPPPPPPPPTSQVLIQMHVSTIL